MDPNLIELGEFGLIELFKRKGPFKAGSGLLKGIGDDCAVFSDGLIVTTDMLIEGRHFTEKTLSPFQLGYKCIAVNLSDIAAMGGRPVGALLGLGLPKETGLDWISEFKRGLFNCLDLFGVDLIGGDTVAVNREKAISITLLGRAENPIFRKGACPGHGIYVGRELGGAGAGLELLLSQGDTERADRQGLLKAHREPLPQIELGLFLSENPFASAMIDVSDGLLKDLGWILKASGKGAVLEADNIPLAPGVASLARELEKEPLDWALHGGEDYCLLFTVPKERERELSRAAQTAGFTLYRIGGIVGEKGLKLLKGGSLLDVEPSGFDHFK